MSQYELKNKKRGLASFYVTDLLFYKITRFLSKKKDTSRFFLFKKIFMNSFRVESDHGKDRVEIRNIKIQYLYILFFNILVKISFFSRSDFIFYQDKKENLPRFFKSFSRLLKSPFPTFKRSNDIWPMFHIFLLNLSFKNFSKNVIYY